MNSNFKAYIQCCDVCDRETIIAESFKSDVRLCFDCAKEAAATATPDRFKNTDSWKIEKEFPTIKDANAEYDRVLAKVEYIKKEWSRLSAEVLRLENKISVLKREKTEWRLDGIDPDFGRFMEKITKMIKETGYK